MRSGRSKGVFVKNQRKLHIRYCFHRFYGRQFISCSHRRSYRRCLRSQKEPSSALGVLPALSFPSSSDSNSVTCAEESMGELPCLMSTFSQPSGGFRVAKEVCASLEPNYQPPVTFVVVQKRQHTTILTAVQLTGVYTYYRAQLWTRKSVIQRSLISISVAMLEYRYARCTRSVSIVPPAYYAHLAAFRARFYMEPETSDSGSMTSGAAAARGGMVQGPGARSMRAPGGNAAVRPLLALKDNVNWVMFYC